MTQLVRPSQFVLSYGPGAILESPSGPVIVPDLGAMIGTLGRNGHSDPSRFEILDQRFTSQPLHPDLPDQPGGEPWAILRIPSNAELKWKDGKQVYPAKAFPHWCLCSRHSNLYMDENGCPDCGPLDRTDLDRKAGQEAYRFVWACRNGHLDDVDWLGFIHWNGSSRAACGAEHLKVQGSGGSTEAVRIVCPVCKRGATLLDLFHKPWPCTRRHAHRIGSEEICGEKMLLQQRGAHALFQPEVVTSLTLEPVGTETFKLARDLLPVFRNTIATLEDAGISFDDLPKEKQANRFAASLHGKQDGRVATCEQQILDDWEGLISLLKGLSGMLPADDRPRKLVEFDRLLAASLYGAPADRNPRPGAPPLFEVRKEAVQRAVAWAGPALRVAPVSRLREVAVQAGFRRMIGAADERPALVSAGVSQAVPGGRKTFFPGVERYGEGLFFVLEDGEELRQAGPRWRAWLERWNRQDGPATAGPFGYPLHPLEVWWHTLAHRLIRSLSLNAGYASSALRERLFFTPPAGERPAQGGLLIYAVQSGGDGTLGGLTSLANNLVPVLNDAVHDLASCSNGPVCDEAAEQREGAACYACLYASETSCEFRNRGLDRLLLLETLEGRDGTGRKQCRNRA